MKINIWFFVLFFQFKALAQLGLNDISILVPLPQNMTEMNQMLGPQPNDLLPRTVYSMLPVLNLELDQIRSYENNLKVVAIRFDPCFMEGAAPTACQPQIRLVWQPIIFKTNRANGLETVTTLDSAVHTFYNLDVATWSQVVGELKNISAFDLRAALQIHPVINAERFNGPYWTTLKKIIFKYAGRQNFARVTVAIVRNGFIWSFQGFDKKQSGWDRIEIPALFPPAEHADAKIINQAFFIFPESLSKLSEFKGGVTLLEDHNKTWFNLIADSEKFLKTQTEDEIKLAMKMAFDIENPNKHNPGTIDCVSCHVAQTIRLWGESHLPQWDFNTLFASSKYANTAFNLKNTSVNPSRVDRVRAFGYFNDEPIISQRIINETAQILNQPL